MANTSCKFRFRVRHRVRKSKLRIMKKWSKDELRVGQWLPSRALIRLYVLKLKKKCAAKGAVEYIQPVRELAEMVKNDPVLDASTNAMFVEALAYDNQDPTGAPAVESWDEFLMLLNEIMHTAPEFTIEKGTNSSPQGLIGFPINAILDWPMGTSAGYATFSNPKFNRYMKKVLNYWCLFLMTPASRYVLAEGDANDIPPSIPWLSDDGKKELVRVAMQPYENAEPATFEQIFHVPDPNDHQYLGFTCWDAFFIRQFNEGIRPVGDADIVNACESGPLQYKTDVALSADFNMKGQPYSLRDMLNNDPLAPQFAGGTVYQAFLSALSYHRWHSPVDGIIEKGFNVDGTYYLQSAAEGIYSEDPDEAAPDASQAFITSIQARAVIFIKADNKDIGMMALVFVGMSEVSSCEITVVEGQRVAKGDELGMFHFGGSTHCLVFQPGVKLDFQVDVSESISHSAENVAVKSNLATAKRALSFVCP